MGVPLQSKRSPIYYDSHPETTVTMELASARIINTVSHLSEAEYQSRLSPLRYSLWHSPPYPPLEPRRDRRSHKGTTVRRRPRDGVRGCRLEVVDPGSRRPSPP